MGWGLGTLQWLQPAALLYMIVRLALPHTLISSAGRSQSGSHSRLFLYSPSAQGGPVPSWTSWLLRGDGWEGGQCLWVVVMMVVAGVEVEMAPTALVGQDWAGTPQRERT